MVFWVDIPKPDIGIDGEWTNVGTFKTKAEAVAWIRENIGDCDDEGRIGLISQGGDNDEF